MSQEDLPFLSVAPADPVGTCWCRCGPSLRLLVSDQYFFILTKDDL